MKRKQLPLFSREFFEATGREGAKQRARNLSPEQRRAIAKKAAKARWSRKDKRK